MLTSCGYVVATDEQVERFGADVFRCYLMFIGPWDEGGPFGLKGISGVERWLNRVSTVALAEPAFGTEDGTGVREMRRLTHKTIRRATEDIERFRFNTMIAALMEMTNGLTQSRDAGPVAREAWNEMIESLLLMLAPLAPHIAEELWQRTSRSYSVHTQSWPGWDADLARDDEITLVVQVNGKVRDRIEVAVGIDEAQAKELALASEQVRKHVGDQQVRRVIYVPGKLVYVVVA